MLHNYWIAIPLIILAAVLFTPFIIYVLIKERRWGWLIAFFFIAILPFIISYLVSYGSISFEAMMLVPFIFYYFYCFLIRLSVNQWIKDYNWHIYYEEQKREDDQRKKWEN